MNEFRESYLKNVWVLIAPNRGKNYEISITEKELPKLHNPFLPGNEAMTPDTIEVLEDSSGWRTRVFPNKFPLLKLETPNETREYKGVEIQGAFGAHEMIIDSNEEGKHFFQFSEEDHYYQLETVRRRVASLQKDSRIHSSFAFKEEGILGGGTIPHSNTQLTSFGFVYPELDTEIRRSKEFFQEKSRSVYEDIIKNARKQGLIVEENRYFVAFVPFSARFEFEIWILPKFEESDFGKLDETRVKILAKMSKEITKKLDIGLGKVGFNWALFTAPKKYEHKEIDYFHKIDKHFRWHIEIIPRLKPIGGFTTGCGYYINSVTPEEAAEHLKKI